MKGRIYSPVLGRFLSPDPHIPAPLASQSYNNYSYVMNNPLRYTDPSGFFFKKILKKFGRLFKKAARYIKQNPRLIIAAAVGYYAGAWAGNAFVKSASSALIGPPSVIASSSYAAAYGQIISTGSIVNGAVSGGVAGVVSSGGLRGGVAAAATGGVLQAVGLHYKGEWTPERVLVSATINGVGAAAAGGSFKNALIAGLNGGALRYAAISMRKMMIAQSMLNPDNASGSSVGFWGDNFKLGGGRYDLEGSSNSYMGGVQGGQGSLFGKPYNPGDWQDYLVEAYAGPHDFLNSCYWYDRVGNIQTGFSPMRRWIGEGLNVVNVVLATPFVAASIAPEYFYSLPH